MTNKRKNANAFVDYSSQIYFPTWVDDQFSEKNNIQTEDATEEEEKIAMNMIIVALWCTQIEIHGKCRRELKSNLLIDSFR